MKRVLGPTSGSVLDFCRVSIGSKTTPTATKVGLDWYYVILETCFTYKEGLQVGNVFGWEL